MAGIEEDEENDRPVAFSRRPRTAAEVRERGGGANRFPVARPGLVSLLPSLEYCYDARVKTPPQSPPVAAPQRVRWLNEQLESLAQACPHTKGNPADCPLCEMRKLPPEAISTWLDGLHVDEKEYLMLYHQCCLVIRWETAHGAQTSSRADGVM